jgi:serine palmitoyltransferase
MINPTNMLPNVHALGYKVGQVIASYWWLLIQDSTLNEVSSSSDTTTASSPYTCSMHDGNYPNDGMCGNHQQQPQHPTFMQPQTIWNMIVSFPVWYREWWWNLVQNDPMHVLVETTLLLAIVYFLVSRRGLPNYKESLHKSSRFDQLTTQEEDELIQQWKLRERQPLTPSVVANGNTNSLNGSNVNNNTYYRPVVIHKSNGRFMEVEDVAEDIVLGQPHGTTLISGDDDTLASNAESTPTHAKTKTVLNFATFDFLGMAADTIPTDDMNVAGESSNNEASTKVLSNKSSKRASNTKETSPQQQPHPVKVASLLALDRYGCGSCGPRGFYGTIDVHMQLEQKIASFLSTDDAILYSDGASAVSSAVAAFCKRGDVVVIDEAVYEPIRTGAHLSRANIKFFAHNDMKDLRRVLLSIQQADIKIGRKSNAQRRFVVVEGLYKNTGTICPLDEIIALKREFNFRLILDESFSFGVLGQTGRGVTELYQRQLMHDVEIMCVSLENSIGSIGGITTGTEEVVDHQRLSGSGYCYSASSPPFTAAAAIASLNLLHTRPEITLHRLQANRTYLHNKLQILLHQKLEDLLLVTSDIRSPIIMLQVADMPETEYLDEVVFLQEVVHESLIRGVAFVATATGTLTSTNTTSALAAAKASDPPPGIRLTVSALHTFADIDKALDVLGDAVDVVMSRFHDEETVM